MSKRQSSVFLQRRNYRRRRLVDLIRMMPVIGALLWAVPLLWPTGEDGGVTTSKALVYVFLVWFGLVVVTALLSRLALTAQVDENLKDG
ncbi:hypothetical protein NNA36_06695 [Shimia sp. CNT1-13L.2]|jgi:hypothetical protein|uniref:hypothetical protein n=1 Tax=Shimia sp. CNT1-13L.2 TaxID=2959663 RepID=UPI0020CD5907|nr:hypothetical protein [Shimia sp. CNT1-13L.2]MCP9481649.1 hypothetical protein [Shimia sp. CNT1-13L.2]